MVAFARRTLEPEADAPALVDQTGNISKRKQRPNPIRAPSAIRDLKFYVSCSVVGEEKRIKTEPNSFGMNAFSL